MRLLTRQAELIEFVARRTQWVSSTGIPVDKSLIGSLSGNKTLVEVLSRKGTESVVGTNARVVAGAGAEVGVGEQPI